MKTLPNDLHQALRKMAIRFVIVLALLLVLGTTGNYDYGYGDYYDPYITDAILGANAYRQDVYDSTNAAWSQALAWP